MRDQPSLLSGNVVKDSSIRIFEILITDLLECEFFLMGVIIVWIALGAAAAILPIFLHGTFTSRAELPAIRFVHPDNVQRPQCSQCSKHRC